jgi:mannose-6-phosphate isomerase-like protein (cupin superfamily)
MVRGVLLALGASALLAAAPASSQTYGPRLDSYFSDWHTAPTQTTETGLTTQPIFTPGDALAPTVPRAVLRFATSFQHAALPAHTDTKPTRLTDRQQILFIESGEGTATAGSQKVHLSPNIALLIPANLEFSLAATSPRPLQMYVIEEPTTPPFHPRTTLLVRDENTLPFSTTNQQWSCMVKPIFTVADGLATLDSVSTISLDPLTVSRPQSTPSSATESVWTALHGTGIAFVSNQLRRQPPGTAFLEVPDGKTPHSIINPNEEQQIRFLYFSHQPAPAPPVARQAR